MRRRKRKERKATYAELAIETRLKRCPIESTQLLQERKAVNGGEEKEKKLKEEQDRENVTRRG